MPIMDQNEEKELTPMAITDFSKAYHEKMFPGYVSKFLETEIGRAHV